MIYLTRRYIIKRMQDNYRKYVAYIRQDMKMKGGLKVNLLASYFMEQAKKQKQNATQDELNDIAINIYDEEKRAGRIQDIINEVEMNMKQKQRQLILEEFHKHF